MTNAIQTLFGRKLHPRIQTRLAAIKIRARGLSKVPFRCERKTVQMPAVSMADLVARAGAV